MNVWVLMKQTVYRQHPEDDPAAPTVLGVYEQWDDVLGRVKRIEKANPQYPLVDAGHARWRIGPEGDEGIFGNKPVIVWAIGTQFTPAPQSAQSLY